MSVSWQSKHSCRTIPRRRSPSEPLRHRRPPHHTSAYHVASVRTRRVSANALQESSRWCAPNASAACRRFATQVIILGVRLQAPHLGMVIAIPYGPHIQRLRQPAPRTFPVACHHGAVECTAHRGFRHLACSDTLVSVEREGLGSEARKCLGCEHAGHEHSTRELQWHRSPIAEKLAELGQPCSPRIAASNVNFVAGHARALEVVALPEDGTANCTRCAGINVVGAKLSASLNVHASHDHFLFGVLVPHESYVRRA
mmetsp:Transcript_25966/g.72488  ORF Transcript_25966/g.72488 Transcript_25966/m.72488 type:complete len:256 (-) Transcript_25966:452-1219(-)